MTYSALGKLEQAKALLKGASEIAAELGDKGVSAVSQIDLGEIYLDLGKLDAAEISFRRAQVLSEHHDLIVYKMGAVQGLGTVYFEKARYITAKTAHEQAVALARSIDDKPNLSGCLLKLAKDELVLKLYEDASEHALAALAIAVQTKRTRAQYEAHQVLAQVHKAQGDFEKTVHHLETFHALREKVFNDENADKTLRLTVKFDFEKARHELEIYRLKSEMSANAQEKAESLVQERTQELENAQLEIVNRLAVAAEYRDDDTGAHTRRVGQTAAVIAYAMGWSLRDVQLLYTAARLHDAGKIGISDTILLKPSKLSDQEFEIMRTHTTIGERILANGHSPLLKMAQAITVAHHEWWDGSGYPRGLAGTAIPQAARIVAVAGVLDALTHKRPYKRAWSVKEALTEVGRNSGAQFDPGIVKVCTRVFGGSNALSPLEVAESWQDLLIDLKKIEYLRDVTVQQVEPDALSEAV